MTSDPLLVAEPDRGARGYTVMAVVIWSLLFVGTLVYLNELNLHSARIWSDEAMVGAPLEQLVQRQQETLRPVLLGAGVVWLLGITFILLFSELVLRRRFERIEAEQKMRRAAAVFMHSHEGVVIADLEGQVVAVNPAFSAITGYDEEEIRGHNLSLLQSGRHDRPFYDRMWAAIAEEGFWRGEIWNKRKNGEVYPEWLTVSAVRDQQGTLLNYVGVFSDISIIKSSQEQLEYLAYHDPLTGLPNRAMLRDRLEHAVERLHRNGGRGAVMFLDLDRFKAVNDSYGHPAGDQVLSAVAERLRQRLREGDTLARVGGDEFVVLLEDIGAPEDVATVAQALIDLFSKLFPLDRQRKVSLGLSVGICLFPDDARQPDEILQHADAALYQAKQGGRNTYRFYTGALTETARRKLALESSLRQALEKREFLLHYQPLVRLGDRRIVGVEALVRWRSPVHGMVSPASFIPLAEESGLIVPLGEWVLNTACQQMRRWLDAGYEIRTLAVNLSPVQFRHAGLLDSVRRALEGSGLAPHNLELEITEGSLMDKVETVEERIRELKRMGIRLAVDDFGTGYSSLAYLRRFAIDKLKIDQSFVRDIEVAEIGQPLVSTIVTLARNLNLHVLAEGIETDVQLNYLQRLGCDYGQGYLFSRPLPPEELAAKLGDFEDCY